MVDAPDFEAFRRGALSCGDDLCDAHGYCRFRSEEYRRLSEIFPKQDGAVTDEMSHEFGPFRFDVARGLLLRGDVPVALGQRSAALLSILLTRRGEILGKDELLDAAWPGVAVEESNLSVQIAALRRALGRTADGREWIVTVQRIGYRFRPAIEAQVTAFRLPTLAILPFTDFDTGAQSEADGFVEDLTTAVSRFKTIALIARNTSFQGQGRSADIPKLARQFGAAYVLEGSRRRVGGCIRTNVQLIDGATGSHLWAETFDQFAEGTTADQLTDRIAARLDGQIAAAETARSRAERPESLSARDLYLRARWHLRMSDEKGNAAAYELAKRALLLEPENIHVLALGAEILHHRISVGWPPFGPDHGQLALELAQHGLSLGINDGAALGLFANALFTAHEWDLGRVAAERAVQANPNSSMALVCAGLCSLWLGRTETERGAELFERALSFGPADPNLRFALNGLAVVSRRRGDHEAAVEFSKRSLAVGRHSASYWNLITASVALGRLDEARRYVTHFRAISPATIASIKRGQPVVDERLLEPVLDALAVAGMPEA